MNKGGFSLKRAVGVTKVKQNISRKTGIPLTKSGRQRKVGKIATGGGCILTLLLFLIFVVIIATLIFVGCSSGSSNVVESMGKASEEQINSETTYSVQTTAVINNNGTKYGLSENQRMQAFYDLAVLQDAISLEDPPDRGNQMLEAYSTIAKQYGITKDEMKEIVAEGMEKNWPMPPVK